MIYLKNTIRSLVIIYFIIFTVRCTSVKPIFIDTYSILDKNEKYLKSVFINKLKLNKIEDSSFFFINYMDCTFEILSQERNNNKLNIYKKHNNYQIIKKVIEENSSPKNGSALDGNYIYSSFPVLDLDNKEIILLVKSIGVFSQNTIGQNDFIFYFKIDNKNSISYVKHYEALTQYNYGPNINDFVPFGPQDSLNLLKNMILVDSIVKSVRKKNNSKTGL